MTICRPLPCAVRIAVLLSMAFTMAAHAEFVWIEGETPTSENLQTHKKGWGHAEVLSGGDWLNFMIAAGDVAGKTPEDGAVMSYEFEAAKAGDYELWHRVGYERVRSPYQWRVDDGRWSDVHPVANPTTDLMAIADWAEVAWLKLGNVTLTPGRHTVTFRVPRQKRGNSYHRMLFATDAIVLSQEPFRPNGPHKPGNDWQTQADRDAASHIFDFAEAKPDGGRTTLDLSGQWMYARFDEQGRIQDRRGPISEIPSADELSWRAIPVPAVREAALPNQWGAHRYFYRARVRVPQSLAGRSFVMTCDEASMLSTVFVNGKQVGFSDAAIAPWRFDITNAIEPGKVNEIWVGIKDAYYAIAPDDDSNSGSAARSRFNTPPGRTASQGFTFSMDFPVARQIRSGLMDKVAITATGPAYADDVYVIPDVAKKQVTVQTTLHNPTSAPKTVTVRTRMVDAETGETAARLADKAVTVPAGESVRADVTGDWADAQLWWPDDPQLYFAVTEVIDHERAIDTTRTRFGYRTWSIEGTRFVLNGVPWQMRANLDYSSAAPGEADAALERWATSGQNMFRLRFQPQWAGMTQNQTLSFFDEHGIPTRKTCSTFDGQFASYRTARSVEVDGRRRDVARTELHENWRKQMAARIKLQRNHPCIFVWEMENEVMYVNNRNRGWIDETEPEYRKAAAMIADLDQQGRGQMIGGGRALTDQSLPINGTHYEAADIRYYPDAAYTLDKVWTGTTSTQPWPMALGKPIFMSEEYFASGYQPAHFASVAGEVAFAGSAEARGGVGRLARMYSEGYRWQELGAFHFWFGGMTKAHEPVWQPVIALVREWNWTFASGAKIERTVMVRNDTHDDSPITLRWRFTVNGKTIASGSPALSIAPGHGETLTLSATMPVVAGRASGTLSLACERGGKVVWQEDKPLSVINPDEPAAPQVAPGELVVWDASGAVGRHLTRRGIPFTPVTDPDHIPAEFRLLIIGPNTLPKRLSTDGRWHRMAMAGRRLLVLDQENPLHYSAIPADAEATRFSGRFAFSQDMTNPIFAGLTQDDLSLWAGDHVVYRNAYTKPTSGGQSLIHADDELAYSALLQCTPGDGLMMLCQMAVGTKLHRDPVAQRLFNNLLAQCLSYRRVEREALAALDESDLRLNLIQTTGAMVAPAKSAIDAMSQPSGQVVIAEATPGVLQQLLDHPEVRASFFASGGDLMLWNLTPDGLAAFNELVGQQHLIRPFTREKVAVHMPRHRLARGLSQSDLRMTGQRIVRHKRTEWVVDDLFTNVISLDQLVPFLEGPGIKPDGNGGSIANGFTDAEYWRYIHYIGYGEGRQPPVYRYTLPRPESIAHLAIVPTTHYQRLRQMRITFEQTGGKKQVETIDLAPYDSDSNPQQDFDLDVPDVERFSVEFTKWEPSDKNILGIDNLWITVKRPSDYSERVQPLLNVGGMVYYPVGKGGILLNQLNIKANETKPDHAEKKLSLVAALLRNLKVQFPDQKVILPGEGLKYHPVSLENKANVYLARRDDEGFPERLYREAGEHDLSQLPVGEQTFRGVRYEIRDFMTSSLENAIGLGDDAGGQDAVTDIQVGRTADALFFLHSLVSNANSRRWLTSERSRRRSPTPVPWRYVVHYADGQTAEVDVVFGLNTHRLTRSNEPTDMRGATVAWTAPYDEGNTKEAAAIYAMQWTNPRPDVPIRSVDVRIVDGKWGSPLILGVTAATAIEGSTENP